MIQLRDEVVSARDEGKRTIINLTPRKKKKKSKKYYA